MLSAWGLHFLDLLRHYVIRPGTIEKVLVITNNIITLDYTYSKHMLKKPHGILCKLIHTFRLVLWIHSRLSWTLLLLGMDQSLLFTHPPRHSMEWTTNRDRPILILIYSTCSGTQDALTPSIPTLISTNSKNLYKMGMIQN